jgi:hypothetical protein
VDDLDLPIGRLRLRPFGGTGGHRGLSSIIKQLGSNQFARLRVGIGRPPGKMDPAAYVLQDFTPQQEEEMLEVRHRAAEAIESWLDESIDAVMNEVNSPPASASAPKVEPPPLPSPAKNRSAATDAASATPANARPGGSAEPPPEDQGGP